MVSYPEYNRLGGLSSNAVYTPYPAPPVDIVDPYKSWRLAALYAQCYYYYPPGLERWLVVEEYSKRGRVTIDNPNCGDGGGGGDLSLSTYSPYEAIPTDPERRTVPIATTEAARSREAGATRSAPT